LHNAESTFALDIVYHFHFYWNRLFVLCWYCYLWDLYG